MRLESRNSNPSLPYPLGATLRDGGANFSLYSRTALRVELMRFEAQDDAEPSRVIELDPATHRSY